MLIYRNLYLRPYGVSNFHLREHHFSPQSRWKFSCMNALDLNGMKRMQSQGETAQRDLRDTVISSRILEPMDNNMMVGEKTKNLYDSSEYGTAMEALSSLITRKKRGDKSTLGGKYTKLERMVMYIKILGLEENITKLKIIHVAGTKGKGSTCTFCEAILRESGFRTGLFTSPHLIDVRERFRLNGLDISQEKFLHYFWECWNQLKKNVTEDLPMPPLFQFLTVLAFKIFTCEKVDVAIIEVGLGGTKDSTNVIKNPVVCGITPLGMDHMESLGNTLGQIASHKAGIFKPQVPAFTVPQLSEAMDVLQEKANELKVPLEVVAPLDHKKLKLSLSGDHQYTNAGLAVALCQSWLQGTGNWEKLFQHVDLENNMPEAFLRGLTTARLSGRAQIVYDSFQRDFNTTRVSENPQGNLTFYLDGAHSPESMEACARWFSSVVKEEAHQSSISKQILLFNCMDTRDPEILLSELFHTCATSGTYFSKAIFVPSISTYNKVTSASSAIPLDIPSKDLAWQFNLQTVWKKITNGKDVHGKNFDMEVSEGIPPQRFFHDDVSNCSTVVASLPLTIRWLRDYVEANPSFKIQVLVTGSLHFVGDVLKLLQQ